MKLAFVIIPIDSPHESLLYLINRTINAFMTDFGGCTFYEVYGQWKGDGKQIKSTKIEVAVKDHQANKFIEIAENVANVAGVEELMIQHPDGTIMFLRGAK